MIAFGIDPHISMHNTRLVLGSCLGTSHLLEEGGGGGWAGAC